MSTRQMLVECGCGGGRPGESGYKFIVFCIVILFHVLIFHIHTE